MHTVILLAGLCCTVYFVGEMLRLARQASWAHRFTATDPQTGRRLRLRLDRRLHERRGERRARF